MALVAVSTTARADDEVQRLDDGFWASPTVYWANGDVSIDQNLWVDIAVANLGYHKSVQIVWTDNGWVTAHAADAWYEGGLGGGFERWGVNLTPLGSLSSRYYGTFWERTYDIPSGDFLMACGECPGPCAQIVVEYAIVYRDLQSGAAYWDSNAGANYQIVIDNRPALDLLRVHGPASTSECRPVADRP